jgi:hypothetical protein
VQSARRNWRQAAAPWQLLPLATQQQAAGRDSAALQQVRATAAGLLLLYLRKSMCRGPCACFRCCCVLPQLRMLILNLRSVLMHQQIT